MGDVRHGKGLAQIHRGVCPEDPWAMKARARDGLIRRVEAGVCRSNTREERLICQGAMRKDTRSQCAMEAVSFCFCGQSVQKKVSFS